MALAHAMHRHNRSNSQDNDAYGGEMIGAESMASGSVTSFVRKLFQMVQAECDSVVGFVADGTAFEVKDPRRLEQDILPKYFRHSRFQSLVRQLNFYSFKKISKERSVWIYKHAFFRRDEPELLHALKRKTNQSGARIIGAGMTLDSEMDGMVLERASLSRVSHNANNTPKPRLRTPSVPRHHADRVHHPFHHNAASTPPSSSSFHRTNTTTNANAGRYSHRSHSTQHVLTPARPGGLRPYHESNSRSAGGGPSTGGVGGAAAAPCYGSSRGASSRAPGYSWAGAGGHPVSAGGSTAGPAEYGDEYSYDYGDDGMVRGSTHLHGDSLPSPRAMQSHTYRRGELAAAGDTSSVSSKKLCSSSAGARSSDREQALALWGLSALCQVASATEATAINGDGEGNKVEGGCNRVHGDRLSGNLLTKAQRSHRRHEGGEECPPKRPCRAGPRGDRGREGGANGQENEPLDYEGEEDGITSAERDDSVASFRSRSASLGSGSESASSTQGSPRESPARAPGRTATSAADHRDRGRSFDNIDEDEDDCQVEVNERKRRGENGRGLATGRSVSSRGDRARSGSGGVFRLAWDWHRAANKPTIRLPGSFVDRRMEETDRSIDADADRLEMMAGGEEDDDEESIRTEAEDVDEEEEDEKEAQERATVKETLVAVAPQPRDLEADMEAEAEVGLEGIGHLFAQLCTKPNSGTPADSVYLATVTNSGDSGLREIAVFCAGAAGHAPDMAPPSSLAEQVSSFLRAEEAVAQDLRIYAEALDPSAVDVVGRIMRRQQKLAPAADAAVPIARRPHHDWTLLRVFCRYAACRLGRAHEVTSAAAASAVCGDEQADGSPEQAKKQRLVAERVTPRLDEYRWKWWRAAVRFS